MGKEEAFIKVIKQHEGVIYKITRAYTNTEDSQKDLYQEIVYQLWRSFDSFKGDAKVSTWMYRVALNTSLTYSKKEKRKGNQVALEKVLLHQDQYDSTKEDRLTILYEHIRMLSDLEKGLIILFLEGKKHKEIAAITGFTISNVGTRISRIKQKLKSQIIKS